MQVFSNIAGSESTHMDAVGTLIDRYQLQDPVAGKGIGEFANADLQALYDQLVEQGSQSLVDALSVGAAIEEIDILDLEEYIAQTDQADIQLVYENLMRGSRNHLRAFVSSLERQGVVYEPAYLSQEQFEDILTSDVERGGGRGGQGGTGRAGDAVASPGQAAGSPAAAGPHQV
jgi:tRNA isopentenyl-2-thiomethyl-A-37 hydroxylase MiaE